MTIAKARGKSVLVNSWIAANIRMDNRSSFLEQRESILRYLAEHPHAADTVEGIINWWLLRQRFNDARAAIEQVLEELVAEGLVTKTYSLDNTVIYGSNTQKSGGMH